MSETFPWKIVLNFLTFYSEHPIRRTHFTNIYQQGSTVNRLISCTDPLLQRSKPTVNLITCSVFDCVDDCGNAHPPDSDEGREGGVLIPFPGKFFFFMNPSPSAQNPISQPLERANPSPHFTPSRPSVIKNSEFTPSPCVSYKASQYHFLVCGKNVTRADDSWRKFFCKISWL